MSTNLTPDQLMKAARKYAGLPAFERNCRLTRVGGRLKKAYKVPGTPEAGRYAMLQRIVTDQLDAYRLAND